MAASSHLLCQLCASKTLCLLKDTLHLKEEDGWEDSGCEMSCGRSLEPLSLPAGMSTLTLTVGTQLSSFPMPTWILKDGQLEQSMSQEAAVIKLDKELFSMITLPRIVTHC